MSVKVHIASDLPGRHIIHYVLQLMAFNKGVEFDYTNSRGDADIMVSNDEHSDFYLRPSFYEYLTYEEYGHCAQESLYGISASGNRDYLSPIFYLLNCIQEYQPKYLDKYGRFPFADSCQKKSGFFKENRVQNLMDELWSTHPKLSLISTSKRRSGVFLTHDIDTIYGAKNQNGTYALDKHLYHEIPRLLWNHYLGKPDWLNIDQMMEIEEEYGFKSVFYWLVRKDKQNADYDISSPVIRDQIKKIAAKGFESGLHKSLTDTSFRDELKSLGEPVLGQRYHFLKFNLPKSWDELERSGIKLDTSLGYSEDFGFRNSYGLPFMPYHLMEKRAYNLIEVPMNVMDGNFFYQGKTVAQAGKELIDWLDDNKFNSIITVNFHNNFFDRLQYKGYQELYITLLKYFREEAFRPMSQTELIKEFYKPGLYDTKAI